MYICTNGYIFMVICIEESLEGLNTMAIFLLHSVWVFFFFFFRDRVSLCILGCPGTHSLDQAGLELKNLPASSSQVLGLKACDTTAQQ